MIQSSISKLNICLQKNLVDASIFWLLIVSAVVNCIQSSTDAEPPKLVLCCIASDLRCECQRVEMLSCRKILFHRGKAEMMQFWERQNCIYSITQIKSFVAMQHKIFLFLQDSNQIDFLRLKIYVANFRKSNPSVVHISFDYLWNT